VEIPESDSFALSVADPVSGRQAVTALQRWNGIGCSVSEADIRSATRDFARTGLLVEPAAVVPRAGSEGAGPDPLAGVR
jgi:threonine synthase